LAAHGGSAIIAPTRRCRQLALLVMVYVALDLANPMMPGAVQLIGAALEAVDGCHARCDEIRAPALPAIPRATVRLAPERRPARPRVGRAAPRVPHVGAVVRAAVEPSGTAPSSSDDD
jgi:hypothetical protein